MNIIITLPKELWTAICAGKKLCELRKSIPSKFTIKQDKVYVAIKGTDQVVGYFNIEYTMPFHSFKATHEQFSKMLQVPWSWIEKYVADCRKAVLWGIAYPYEFYLPVSRSISFALKSNPQSYVYTDVDIADDFDADVQRSEERKKAVQ